MAEATSLNQLNPLLENGSPAGEHTPGTERTRVHLPDGEANPCMAGIDRCDEALGGGGGTNWQAVGVGRGSYEVVETLVYVGPGKGNFDKDVEPVKKAPGVKITWQRKLYMSILCSLLFAGAISLTVSMIIGPRRQAIRPPLQQDVAKLDEGHRITSTAAQHPEELKASCEKAQQTWSLQERQFCCASLGLGCPDLKCQSGRDDWQHAWSPGKKIWCCKHYHVGCGPSEAHTRTRVENKDRKVPEAPPTVKVAVTKVVPGMQVLPASGMHALPALHRPEKAPSGFWRPMEVSVGNPRQESRASLRGQSQPPTTTTEPFQCAGESKGWSDKRQEWCCWHYGTGCPR